VGRVDQPLRLPEHRLDVAAQHQVRVDVAEDQKVEAGHGASEVEALRRGVVDEALVSDDGQHDVVGESEIGHRHRHPPFWRGCFLPSIEHTGAQDTHRTDVVIPKMEVEES
jgi:hypothetical protein